MRIWREYYYVYVGDYWHAYVERLQVCVCRRQLVCICGETTSMCMWRDYYYMCMCRSAMRTDTSKHIVRISVGIESVHLYSFSDTMTLITLITIPYVESVCRSVAVHVYIVLVI